MFRVLAVLSMLSVGCGLVLTDKTQPTVNASEDDTVELAAEKADESKTQNPVPPAGLSKKDQDDFQDTMLDEGEEEKDEKDDATEAKIKQQEKEADVTNIKDSDEPMEPAEGDEQMWQDFDKVQIKVDHVLDGSGILEREEVDSLLLSPQISSHSAERRKHIWKTYQVQKPLSPDVVQNVLEELDKSKDGKIVQAEFEDLYDDLWEEMSQMYAACLALLAALGVVPGPWQRQPNDGGISCIAVPKESIMLVVNSEWDLELVASGGYQITPAAMAVGTSSATATLRGFGSLFGAQRKSGTVAPAGHYAPWPGLRSTGDSGGFGGAWGSGCLLCTLQVPSSFFHTSHGRLLKTGALIISYTVLGVPYYSCSIICPKTLPEPLRAEVGGRSPRVPAPVLELCLTPRRNQPFKKLGGTRRRRRVQGLEMLPSSLQVAHLHGRPANSACSCRAKEIRYFRRCPSENISLGQ
ncbi:unnamed protein product [Symbiodinium necroappetens]|uniref:EF-hand domain-containing protein n=1 Tax=Symbiodinium necroappetens TaxID=1628268 RepID=A0A812TU07_9DINO|nr:unnamed protein product [Symbiodinium necroappetens]